jgi:hypothetical protein
LEQNQPKVSPSPVSLQPENSPKRSKKPLIIAFAVIGVIVVLLLLVLMLRSSKSNQSSPVTSTTNPSVSNQTTKSKTTGLKTYRATNGKFSMQYPAEWTIFNQKEGTVPAYGGRPPYPQEWLFLDSTSNHSSGDTLELNYDFTSRDAVELSPKYGGCGPGHQTECDTGTIFSIDQIDIPGKGKVMLIKELITGGTYQIVLHQPSSDQTTPRVGPENGMINYFVPGEGDDQLHFSVSLPAALTAKSSAEAFASDQAKTAETVLRSIRFE